MEKLLRILLLEDSPSDAELIRLELERGGVAHVSKCVSTRDEFLAALSEFKPDLVLADYKLPEINGTEALSISHKQYPHLPFILVTGALGEELAVDTIKRGATDYILKDRLSRLAPAVQRAMQEAEQRAKRHRAEQELRQSEQRFRQLTDSIREVFWMTDPHKNQMIYISPAYEAIWGRTCESLYASPRTWLEAIHPEDRERVFEAALTKQTAGQYDEQYRIVRPDGAIRWIHDRAFPILDGSGKVYRIAGIAEDFTAHKLAEQAARESEARKSAIMESVVDAILTIDSAGRIAEFNSAAEKIFGHRRTDVVGKEMAEVIIPPSLRARHRRGFARYLATGENSILGKRIELQAMRSDGAEFPAELTVTRVKLDGPPAFTAYIRDISERKSEERRLEARNAVIRTLAESATLEEAAKGVLRSISECLGWEVGAFWEVENKTNTLRSVEVWCSPATKAREFLDVTRSMIFSCGEGLPGRVWLHAKPVWILDLLADPNFRRGPIAAKCALRGAFGFPILLRNEVIGVIEFLSHEIREPDSSLLGMMSALGSQIGQFIARKQAEEALQKAEANYRSIYENAIEGIFQTTPEGRYLSANPALARMMGYDSPEDLIASVSNISQQICVDPESRAELMRLLDANGYVRGFVNQAYRKDGSIIWISINARIVRDARGEVVYYEGTSQDITERKRAEEQIQVLANAVQSTKDFISITDCDNRFTFVNQAFLEAYGYTEKEVLGRRPDFLYSPRNPPGLYEEIFQRTLLGGWQGELLDCRKDGSEFPISLSTSQIKDAQGRILGLVGVARDISERKQAEKRAAIFSLLGYHLSAATASKRVAELIMEAASDLLTWDAGYVHLYSETEDTIIPLVTFEVVNGHRRDIQPTNATLQPSPLLRSVMKKGARLLNLQDPTFASVIPPSFGSAMCVPIRLGKTTLGVVSLQSRKAQVYSLKDLELLHALADHCGDALERIRIADSLHQMEGNYRSIFENANEGIFQATPEGRFVIANPALVRMFGYDSPEEMKSAFVPHEQTFVHPETLAELKRLVTEHGSVKGFEAERFRKDRTRFWVSMNVHAIRDESGAFLFFEGTEQDITQRKRAESVLQESERKLGLIAENTTDVIFAYDMEGRPVYVNPALEKLTGYTPADLQEKGFINWTHPDDQERMTKHWKDLYAGKSHTEVEFRLVTKTGQIKWSSSTWGPLFDESGHQVGVHGRERDITERKELEREVLESTANERRRIGHELHDGLGQYLAGVAFRAKALETTLLAEGSPSACEAKELARLISNSISQTRNLARGLDPVEVEADGLITLALQSLAADAEQLFSVACDFSCRHPALRLPAQQGLGLYRIAQEAIHNAITHGGAKRIEIELTLNNDNLLLRVGDDGVGFEVEGGNNGDGMGLRLMKYRARAIGAELTICSKPSKGTEIRCLLAQQAPVT